jgi:hypothetical protein
MKTRYLHWHVEVWASLPLAKRKAGKLEAQFKATTLSAARGGGVTRAGATGTFLWEAPRALKNVGFFGRANHESVTKGAACQ